MSTHKLADLFPRMSDAEIQDLANDIAAHGQHEPIVLLNGEILDGRNRMAACEIAGVEPRIAEYDGDDPLGYVVSLNLKRRHLTESQRAMVAAKLATAPSGLRTDLEPTANWQEVTSAEAADTLSVSERSVNRARAVRNGAPAAVVEAVERGEIPVSTAQKIMKSPSLAPLMSSSSDEWYTPDHIWKAAARVVDAFDLDPCADPGDEPNVPAGAYYRKVDDGLAHEWNGRVWMNPPYSMCSEFVAKLIDESVAGRCSEFIALVPARVDTKWWDTLTGWPDCTVCFVRGRLKFKGGEHSAPFPSALVYGGRRAGRFTLEMMSLGRVWIVAA